MKSNNIIILGHILIAAMLAIMLFSGCRSHLEWAQQNCDKITSICCMSDSIPTNTSSSSYKEEDSVGEPTTMNSGIFMIVDCDSLKPRIRRLEEKNKELNTNLKVKSDSLDRLLLIDYNSDKKVHTIYKTITKVNIDTIYKKIYVNNPINKENQKKVTQLETKTRSKNRAIWTLSGILALIVLVVVGYLYLKIKK